MRTGAIVVAVIAVIAIAIGFYMVDVDVSGETELPDVDVTVEGGELPEAEVNVGDVDVGTEEVTVEVPTIDVEPAGDGDDVADGDAVEQETTQAQ